MTRAAPWRTFLVAALLYCGPGGGGAKSSGPHVCQVEQAMRAQSQQNLNGRKVVN